MDYTSIIDEKLIAPCGLYCGWCPYYLMGTKGFKCEGCWERKGCPIRDCAKARGLKLCTLCNEFPCNKLYEAFRSMDKFFDRIKRDFPNGVKLPKK